MQPAAVRRVAPVASVASFVFMAVVAATPRSAFQPLLPANARGSGPFRWVSATLGLDSASASTLAVVAVVAIVIAAAAFALLAYATWMHAVPVRAVVAIALVGHAIVALVPLLFSRDVYSYAYYGRIAAVYHANPYVATPLDFPHDALARYVGPKWVDTPAVYGPVWVLVSEAVVRAVTSITAMIDLFRALAIVASLSTLAVITWTVRRLWSSRLAFALAVFGANPVILFHSVASGHNDLWVALAIAGAFALAATKRTKAAVVVLALGALVKATAALPLLLLVVAVLSGRPRGERLRAAVTHLGLAAAVALAFAVPFLQSRDPTLGMLELAGHEGWLAPSRFFHRLFDVVGLGWLARIAFAVALVLVVVAISRMLVGARRGDAIELGAAWAWSLLFLVLLGPVLLPWYVAWVLPLAWLLPRVPRVVLIALCVALVLSQLRTEPSTLPQLYDASLIVGHYVFTPVVIALLLWLGLDLRRRVRSSTPLAGEREDATTGGDGEHERLRAEPP